MAKTTKTTETVVTNLPATVEQIKQTDLPGMLRVIDAKISALKGDDKEESTGKVEVSGFGLVADIKDPMALRACYAQVVQKSRVINEFNEVFKQAAPTIEVKTYKESGNSTEQILKSILSQYKKVVFKEELDKLVKAKEKIQQNLSQEDKMRADLLDAFSLLGITE